MKIGVSVLDAMTRNPVVVSPEITLDKCAKLMKQKHVGALLIKEGDNVVGIATEQDIVRKAVLKDWKPSKVKIKDVMERKLLTISSSEDVFEAISMMRDYNVRHLPIIENGKFIGLVTAKDILKIEPDLFELLVEKIELRKEQTKSVRTNQEAEIDLDEE